MYDDISDVLSWFDAKEVYNDKSTCIDCYVAGQEQAVTIIVNIYRNGDLIGLLRALDEAVKRNEEATARWAVTQKGGKDNDER